MTEGPDEAERLLAAVAKGSEAALGRLLSLFARPLAAFAGRYLGRPDMGEDIVQETFLKVWRDAASFDATRGSAKGWIWRIATNTCIDTSRRLAVRRFIGLGGPVEDYADTLADPRVATDDDLAARQHLRIVRQEIGQLPARQRMALLLTAVSGLDSNEVAAIMKTSRGSIEQLLVRARRTLREKLGDL